MLCRNFSFILRQVTRELRVLPYPDPHPSRCASGSRNLASVGVKQNGSAALYKLVWVPKYLGMEPLLGSRFLGTKLAPCFGFPRTEFTPGSGSLRMETEPGSQELFQIANNKNLCRVPNSSEPIVTCLKMKEKISLNISAGSKARRNELLGRFLDS
jgi:hypothetical protein